MKRTPITTLEFFYKLKPRKKLWCEANIELDVGKEFFVYSFHSKNLFRREVYESINLERMQELINLKVLCH